MSGTSGLLWMHLHNSIPRTLDGFVLLVGRPRERPKWITLMGSGEGGIVFWRQTPAARVPTRIRAESRIASAPVPRGRVRPPNAHRGASERDMRNAYVTNDPADYPEIEEKDEEVRSPARDRWRRWGRKRGEGRKEEGGSQTTGKTFFASLTRGDSYENHRLRSKC
ncbi:hypothetical protein L596_014367 [Steinernema carpocapsae]|uniref:Uncharacterized protein n=1 Tax=Steinernema carpocapsae TaxID=34508 RepID=A0A4U5NBX8_STECR|nr:hypothetical protein L596_014367 [Steinernema carpocapsae]